MELVKRIIRSLKYSVVNSFIAPNTFTLLRANPIFLAWAASAEKSADRIGLPLRTHLNVSHARPKYVIGRLEFRGIAQFRQRSVSCPNIIHCPLSRALIYRENRLSKAFGSCRNAHSRVLLNVRSASFNVQILRAWSESAISPSNLFRGKQRNEVVYFFYLIELNFSIIIFHYCFYTDILFIWYHKYCLLLTRRQHCSSFIFRKPRICAKRKKKKKSYSTHLMSVAKLMTHCNFELLKNKQRQLT